MKTVAIAFMAFAVVMLCAFTLLTVCIVASGPAIPLMIVWGVSGTLAVTCATASTLLKP